MITLVDGSTTITLPDDLVWTDEFSWSPVEQNVEYSLSGALVVQEGRKLKGRSITLTGYEDSAWIKRSVVKQLYTLSSSPAKVMTLNFHGETFSVMFRRPAFEVVELLNQSNPGDNDYYSITLYLIEV